MHFINHKCLFFMFKIIDKNTVCVHVCTYVHTYTHAYEVCPESKDASRVGE